VAPWTRIVLQALACLLFSCAAASQTSPQSLRHDAIALEQQGNNVQAAQAWQAIVKLHPSDAEAYAHLGLIAAREQRYDNAVALYRKALALNAKFPGLRLNLGLAYFKGGRLKDAIQQFRLLLSAPSVSPADSLRLNELTGMAHYGLGEYAQAVPYLQAAAAADKRNLPLRLALAHSCLWSKNNPCVMDTYKEILEIDPESAEAYVLAGEAMDAMKNSTGAIEQFRHAIQVDPKLPHVHFGLGYLLWTQKDYPGATSEFRAELALDPDYMQALLYLADCAIKTDQLDVARPLLERVVVMAPAEPLGHLDLGIIYSESGRKDEALHQLTIAEKLMPGDEVTTDQSTVHWRLGQLYKSMGKMEEAKAELAKAAAVNRAADEAVYKKMSSGNARPPASAPAGTELSPATGQQPPVAPPNP